MNYPFDSTVSARARCRSQAGVTITCIEYGMIKSKMTIIMFYKRMASKERDRLRRRDDLAFLARTMYILINLLVPETGPGYCILDVIKMTNFLLIGLLHNLIIKRVTSCLN